MSTREHIFSPRASQGLLLAKGLGPTRSVKQEASLIFASRAFLDAAALEALAV